MGADMVMHCADKHGAFVQPALYEAFGLTVVEAMSCGLPTFATIKGGPAEVIATYLDQASHQRSSQLAVTSVVAGSRPNTQSSDRQYTCFWALT